MKTITILFFFMITALTAEITTFNGEWAHWGWFGNNPQAGEVSGPVVKVYLKKNWGKVHPFAIQAEVGNKNHVEFLWKITPDLVTEAEKSGSSYIVGGVKITNVVLSFNSKGSGKISLYSKGTLVGRANCQTAGKREGKYSQLAAGNYNVLGKKEMYVSTEFPGAKMPFSLLLDDIRKIYIHQGDISSLAAGCIRLSKPVAKTLFSLLRVGIPVKVIHEP